MKAHPATILDDAAASHVPVLVDVLENIGAHDYEFMSNANYDVLELPRVLWFPCSLPRGFLPERLSAVASSSM
jgi:hypothetical protein